MFGHLVTSEIFNVWLGGPIINDHVTKAESSYA